MMMEKEGGTRGFGGCSSVVVVVVQQKYVMSNVPKRLITSHTICIFESNRKSIQSN